jgi:hypothetical protein
MTDHGSRPEESGIREKDKPLLLPTAWQPLTFRGVAAFSRAPIGRLLLVQLIVSLLVAAAILWCLQLTWFQRVPAAIRALPPTGSIENRVLTSPRTSPEPLAADGFLAISINLNQSASLGSASDVRLEFHRTDYTVCSLFGCLKLDYPADTLPFNQPELEAWWGAWRWTILASIVIGTIGFLFANWFFVATCYAFPAWFLAYFKDRELSPAGSWKLTAAALLAPALGVGGAVVLYSLNAVDLLQLLLLWGVHVPLGWAYAYCAVLRLPVVSHAQGRKSNPFGSGSPRSRKKAPNPFTPSSADCTALRN